MRASWVGRIASGEPDLNHMIVGLVFAAASAASVPDAEADLRTTAMDRRDFPVLIRRGERTFAAHQALIRGHLVLDAHGCLRVGDGGPLVIWHHDSAVERLPDGRIRITDGFTGNVAHVGDEIALGGSGGPHAPSAVIPAIPDACAGGEYWMAGQLMSETERLEMLERERNRVPVPLPPQAGGTLSR